MEESAAGGIGGNFSLAMRKTVRVHSQLPVRFAKKRSVTGDFRFAARAEVKDCFGAKRLDRFRPRLSRQKVIGVRFFVHRPQNDEDDYKKETGL